MIVNITNEIFNAIYNACPTAKVVKGNPNIAPSFPCVTFNEMINVLNDASVDTVGEFANDITFEINIFSNSETPISECNSFKQKIDDVMSGTYRMQRSFSENVPNYEDKSIYRYILRYQCVVDKNNKLYRR